MECHSQWKVVGDEIGAKGEAVTALEVGMDLGPQGLLGIKLLGCSKSFPQLTRGNCLTY